MIRKSRLAPVAALLATGLSWPAHGYNEAIHEMLPGKAFAADLPRYAAKVQAASRSDIEAFRRYLYDLWSAQSEGFRGRHPSSDAFGTWELKSFLMLNPGANVWGIDRSHEGETRTRGEWWMLASRLPDDDARNQARFRRDNAREVSKDPWGRPLPEDPATVEMGTLEGTGSQGHAHYGLLPPAERTSHPIMLRIDPRRFSLPQDAHSWSVEFAGLYTDLALLARLWGRPGSDYLEAIFTGAAWHHIGDVANQIHTIQVGLPEFLEDSVLISTWDKLLSQGGLIYKPKTIREIGSDILNNHHLVSEDIFAQRVGAALDGKSTDPVFQQLLASLPTDVPEFRDALAKALAGYDPAADTSFGAMIAAEMVQVSSHEGPEVYKHIHQAASEKMSKGYQLYEGKGDLAPWLRTDPAGNDALAALFTVQARGLLRAATALRYWEAQSEGLAATFAGDGGDDGRRDHLARRVLNFLEGYHREAEARRQAWQPKAPAGQEIMWRFPLYTLGLILIFAGGGFGLRKRFQSM